MADGDEIFAVSRHRFKDEGATGKEVTAPHVVAWASVHVALLPRSATHAAINPLPGGVESPTLILIVFTRAYHRVRR